MELDISRGHRPLSSQGIWFRMNIACGTASAHSSTLATLGQWTAWWCIIALAMAMTVEIFCSAISLERCALTPELLLKVFLEVITGEGASIVTQEVLWCHTARGTELLMSCQESCVRSSGVVTWHEYAHWTVQHDTTIFVLVIILLLSICVQQSTNRIAHEVLKRCLLVREQFVLLQCASFLLDGLLDWPRLGLAMLFCTLSCSTQRTLGQVCSRRLQMTSFLRSCKDSLSEHPLDASYANVSRATMPMEKLLIGFHQVDVTWHGEGWMFLHWQWILGFLFSLSLFSFHVAYFGTSTGHHWGKIWHWAAWNSEGWVVLVPGECQSFLIHGHFLLRMCLQHHLHGSNAHVGRWHAVTWDMWGTAQSIVGIKHPSHCATSFNAWSFSSAIHNLILAGAFKVGNKVFELIGHTAVCSRVKQCSVDFLRINGCGGHVSHIHNRYWSTLQTESKSCDKGTLFLQGVFACLECWTLFVILSQCCTCHNWCFFSVEFVWTVSLC